MNGNAFVFFLSVEKKNVCRQKKIADISINFIFVDVKVAIRLNLVSVLQRKCD